MKQYLFKNNFLVEATGTSEVMGQVDKLGTIIENDCDSDLDMISAFCCPILNLEDGSFRLYYSAIKIAGQESEYYISIAESKDLRHWKKPALGQHFLNGENTNRLRIKGIPEGCFTLQPSIVKLTDDNWQMFCWVHGKGYCRYVMCKSQDGINWAVINFARPCVYHPNDKAQAGSNFRGLTEFYESGQEQEVDPRAAGLKSNDATMTYYDSETGKYQMYSVWLFDNYPESGHYIDYDNAPHAYRVIQYRESSDGLNWGIPRIILTPDSCDPNDLQFYYLSQQEIADFRIGMLGYYPVADQTMDIEFIFSNDGIDWERPFRGSFPIGRSTANMCLASHNMIKNGDEYLIPYSVFPHKHNMPPEPVGNAIQMAKIKDGRFRGVAAGLDGALIKTKPIVLSKSEILINADIRGQMKVELCDAFGKNIDGFAYAQFKTIKGDSLKHKLSWEKKISDSMLNQAYTLNITWTDGEIYSVEY